MLALALVAALELGSLPSQWTIRSGWGEGRRHETVTLAPAVINGERTGRNEWGDPVTIGVHAGRMWIRSEQPKLCRFYAVDTVRGGTLRGTAFDFSADCQTLHCIVRPGILRCSRPFRARAALRDSNRPNQADHLR